MSFNETTPEPVKETVTAENIENTKKSVNAIRTAEIYIYTSTYEAVEAANLEDTAFEKEDTAFEKENFAAEKQILLKEEKGDIAKK